MYELPARPPARHVDKNMAAADFPSFLYEGDVRARALRAVQKCSMHYVRRQAPRPQQKIDEIARHACTINTCTLYVPPMYARSCTNRGVQRHRPSRTAGQATAKDRRLYHVHRSSACTPASSTCTARCTSPVRLYLLPPTCTFPTQQRRSRVQAQHLATSTMYRHGSKKQNEKQTELYSWARCRVRQVSVLQCGARAR